MTRPRRPSGTGWLPLVTPPTRGWASPGAGGRGQGQAVGLLQGSVLAGLCGDKSPAWLRNASPAPSPPGATAVPQMAKDPEEALRDINGPPGDSPEAAPSPLHACSWLVSTFRISLTQAALISGVGACAAKADRKVSACVPEGRVRVSLCRRPGPSESGLTAPRSRCGAASPRVPVHGPHASTLHGL